MGRKIYKHVRIIQSFNKPLPREDLHTQNGSVFLNRASVDRITFSVLRNSKDNIRKIENISYEILIDNRWEWVVRYDDHGGLAQLHRHVRFSLEDARSVVSSYGIKNFKSKDGQLTWVCKDIKRNYLIFRRKFLKNSGLDLY
jgi:hypothetical protein